MHKLLPLKSPHLKHLFAELHAQAMHFKVSPLMIKEYLGRHRLTMPWRRGLAHQKNVRRIFHKKRILTLIQINLAK
jgi:hypothetical protein